MGYRSRKKARASKLCIAFVSFPSREPQMLFSLLWKDSSSKTRYPGTLGRVDSVTRARGNLSDFFTPSVPVSSQVSLTDSRLVATWAML